MNTLKAQEKQQLWMKPVHSPEEKNTLTQLRQRIYAQSGKVAEAQAYQSSMDHFGQAYFIGFGEKIIGTFSVCLLGQNESARDLLSQQWGVNAEQFKQSIYIYFLGIERHERRASVLKFVFGEVFKILVKNRLQDIYVLADVRLQARYRWIGLRSTQHQVKSSFPKSGWLTLLHTRQIRLGIYGLHADPLRWNWYLRSAIHQLLSEGFMPAAGMSRLIYFLYTAFSPLASVAEILASMILRRGKEQLLLQRKV